MYNIAWMHTKVEVLSITAIVYSNETHAINTYAEQ